MMQIIKPLLLVFGLSTIIILGSCAKTQKVEKAQPKGFLEGYSQLSPDPEGVYKLIYINPDANFNAYNKVWIESITAYVIQGSDLAKVPEDDIQELLNYAKIALERDLGKDYQIVDSPGPGVMQIRAAFTEASGANVLLDTVTTAAPPARAFSALKKLATGTQAFVGKAAFEGEVVDSQTEERLIAAIGARAGGKTLKTEMSSWRDVKAAVDVWAEDLRVRLERLRASSPSS